jgi:hypothetical protein
VLVAVKNGGVEIEDNVLDIAFDINLKHEVYISPRVMIAPLSLIPYGALLLFLKLLQKRALLCETRV